MPVVGVCDRADPGPEVSTLSKIISNGTGSIPEVIEKLVPLELLSSVERFIAFVR